MLTRVYGRYICGEHYWIDGTTGRQWSLFRTDECPDEFEIDLPDGSTDIRYGRFANGGIAIENVVNLNYMFDDGHGKSLWPAYINDASSAPEIVIPMWNQPTLRIPLTVLTINGEPAYIAAKYPNSNSDVWVYVPARHAWRIDCYDRYGEPTTIGYFQDKAEAAAAIAEYRAKPASERRTKP